MLAKPKSIVCDNDTEFTSIAMFYWSRVHVFVESFNGKFRDSCLKQYWFHSLEDAKITIENWRRDYNRVSPHSSLGTQPPSVFAEKPAVLWFKLENPGAHASCLFSQFVPHLMAANTLMVRSYFYGLTPNSGHKNV